MSPAGWPGSLPYRRARCSVSTAGEDLVGVVASQVLVARDPRRSQTVAAPEQVVAVVGGPAQPRPGERVVRLDPGVIPRQAVPRHELERKLPSGTAGDDAVSALPRRVDALDRPTRKPIRDLSAHAGAAGVG